MTVGQELAVRRRNLGLSLTELSSKSSVSVELLRSVEQTDLAHLPSADTLEHAIRAYASAVRLDPDEISSRYLANLPIIPNTGDALTAFEPEGGPVSVEPAGRLFVFEPEYEAPPVARGDRQTAVAAPPSLLLHSEPDLGALPMRPDPAGDDFPRAPIVTAGREHRLPLAALLLVAALAVVGGYVLSARGGHVTQSQSAEVTARSQPAHDARSKSLDPTVEHAAGPPAPVPPPAPAVNETKPPAQLQSSDVPSKRSRQPLSRADARVPSALITVPGSPAPPAPDAKASASAGNELTGSWSVITHAESSTVDADTNKVTYYLRLEQWGTRIGGSGYRISEQGADAASSQQPVAVAGTLTGERLTLNFSGQNREHFVLYRADDGVFRGRFRKEAEPSGGSSVVTLAPRGPIRPAQN